MKQNRLMRIVTFPKRALAKAGEFYVQTMNSFADVSGCSYGAATFGMVEPLPRSFSTSSAASRSSHADDNDLKELIRAASASRAYAKKLDLAALDPPRAANNGNGALAKGPAVQGVQRSASVGMAKIEEDKACEDFEDDVVESRGKKDEGSGAAKKKEKGLFGRSRSYAVSTTTQKRF